MNQETRILNYMRDFGSITPKDAIMDLGVYRLASRISNLKKRGYRISMELEKGTNRYGEGMRYARYRLEDENE